MPYITVESGVLSDTQKEELMKQLTGISSEIMKIPQEFFVTVIKEFPDKNFGIGGKTIDKVKSEYMQTHNKQLQSVLQHRQAGVRSNPLKYIPKMSDMNFEQKVFPSTSRDTVFFSHRILEAEQSRLSLSCFFTNFQRKDKLKPVERRSVTLKKNIEQADIYFKYKRKKLLTIVSYKSSLETAIEG